MVLLLLTHAKRATRRCGVCLGIAGATSAEAEVEGPATRRFRDPEGSTAGKAEAPGATGDEVIHLLTRALPNTDVRDGERTATAWWQRSASSRIDVAPVCNSDVDIDYLEELAIQRVKVRQGHRLGSRAIRPIRVPRTQTSGSLAGPRHSEKRLQPRQAITPSVKPQRRRGRLHITSIALRTLRGSVARASS